LRQRTSSDPVIVEALRAGTIAADPDTGRIYLNGRLAACRVNGQGYRIMTINGRTCSQHRIVWIAANGPIPDGLEINHLNGQRDDNRLVNLEIVTHAENVLHARRGLARNHTRPDDEAVVDPAWLAQVLELATAGATREQIAQLRPQVIVEDDGSTPPLRGPWTVPFAGTVRARPNRRKRR
jgi:hypothetical protein